MIANKLAVHHMPWAAFCVRVLLWGGVGGVNGFCSLFLGMTLAALTKKDRNVNVVGWFAIFTVPTCWLLSASTAFLTDGDMVWCRDVKRQHTTIGAPWQSLCSDLS